GGQALVRPRDVRRADAAARNGGGRPRALCGGVHEPQGRARTVKFVPTELEGAYVVEPELHEDERGFFARTWSIDELAAQGLVTDLSQCSISRNTHAGTLRGMHFQPTPHEEVKLVRCTAGTVYDVLLDLRPASPTHAAWV